MKGLAGIFAQQSKELQDVDLSKFQGGAVNGVGLIEAWKKGEIKFQYVGDEIILTWKPEEDRFGKAINIFNAISVKLDSKSEEYQKKFELCKGLKDLTEATISLCRKYQHFSSIINFLH